MHTLSILAWLNVFLHLAGLAFAALGMSPGTPLAPLDERLDYLAGTPIGWWLGWTTWMLCALCLIAFLAVLTHRLGPAAELARLGLVIALIGAVFDLLLDAVYIVLLPMIASMQPREERLFLVVERAAGIGSLVIANGAYCVGILLITIALRGRAGVGKAAITLGYLVTLASLILAAAGFTGSPGHARWATPPTMGLFCVWVVVVARQVGQGGGSA